MPDLDAAIAHQLLLGVGPWFRIGPFTPSGARFRRATDGARSTYLDTRHDLPGLFEVIEMTGDREGAFAAMRVAADGWDGSDPVRPLGPPDARPV